MGGSTTTRVEVRRHADPGGLREAAGGFLLAREAEHNLLLGICSGLDDGTYEPAQAYLASVHAGGEVVAAAVRTPPRNLVVSCVDDRAALPALACDVAGVHEDLPGVTAPVEVSAVLARTLARLRRCEVEPGMAMRIHRAEHVHAAVGVSGRMREATVDDADLIVAWARDFEFEALAEERVEDEVRAWAGRMLGSSGRGLVLWEHAGEPVSMAGYGGPSPNGIQLFAVYTPPEQRGHGYATACVATLTARLLAEGRRFCFLFTDRANPMSNRLYRRVGYEPVIDVDEHRLVG